jgi:aconitate hydratase
MKYPRVQDPEKYLIDEKSIFAPLPEADAAIEIYRGPNIKPLPEMDELPDLIEARVVIKVGDNISTDTIMPAGNKVLPLRSNVAAISEYVYSQLNPDFHKEAKTLGISVVVGGENYGQGSSREHAALAPRYLGIRAKICKSFARIHLANLCNYGILPLVFRDADDYEKINRGSKIVFRDVRKFIESGATEISVEVDGQTIVTLLDVSDRQRKHLLAGGALNFIKKGLMP